MDLELIERLDPIRPGQTLEIYRRGEEYFYISTVPDVSGPDLSPAQRATFDLGNFAAAVIGKTPATSGEETMAFHCDAEGNVEDWGGIAVAVGEGSREAVLAELQDEP